MRKLVRVLYTLLISVVLIGCEDAIDNSVIVPVPPGAYAYTGYDSTGIVIVKGWLSFTYQDSIQFSGEWQFQKVGNPERIGPQVGTGTLVGGIEEQRVWVDLNPQYADNNVFLSGQFEGNRYHGQWSWGTFAGVSNRGTFEAVKN